MCNTSPRRVLTLEKPRGIFKLYGLENNSVHRNTYTEIICCPVGGTQMQAQRTSAKCSRNTAIPY